MTRLEDLDSFLVRLVQQTLSIYFNYLITNLIHKYVCTHNNLMMLSYDHFIQFTFKPALCATELGVISVMYTPDCGSLEVLILDDRDHTNE